MYDKNAWAFLPFLARALKQPEIKVRELLQFIQKNADKKRIVSNTFLLVKTLPPHIRTVFARVVDSLLPQGVRHTAASILEPDTTASGNIYKLYGESPEELSYIPLEFYILEPYREHVFFSDRDQLTTCLEDPKVLFRAMETAPQPNHHKCATFIVKGEQLLNLKSQNWIQTEPLYQPFPGFFDPKQQFEKIEHYMHSQPSYPYLEAIEKGLITSQGILLSRFFPSPTMKRMLLSEQVYQCLKGIYFEKPSRSHGDFFSREDRAMLFDLAKFGIPVLWLDRKENQVLRYVFKSGKESGMFVPLSNVKTFLRATIFGLYGDQT